jgi:hypothetical protein
MVGIRYISTGHIFIHPNDDPKGKKYLVEGYEAKVVKLA